MAIVALIVGIIAFLAAIAALVCIAEEAHARKAEDAHRAFKHAQDELLYAHNVNTRELQKLRTEVSKICLELFPDPETGKPTTKALQTKKASKKKQSRIDLIEED